MSRKQKDNFLQGIVYMCAGLTAALLIVIIGFIFWKGMPGITPEFLTHAYEGKTTYITSGTYKELQQKDDVHYVGNLGIEIGIKEEKIFIEKMDAYSPLKQALDSTGNIYEVKKGDQITKIGEYDIGKSYEDHVKGQKMSEEQFLQEIKTVMQEEKNTSVKLKVVRPGGGIVPMAVTTLYTIGLSIGIAGPVGILGAIYLNEYAKKGKLLHLIHFSIENLAGIPSIIYGLFGSVFFVTTLKFQYSILAGAMTVSIILLPTIINTTEEALKAVPRGIREASLGLGATKFQTISRVVLPNAVPGILVAILLSIGRVVGESAALLLTAGTAAQIPKALVGNSASGATLTIKAYTLMKEENDLTTACAIGIILLLIIICINAASKGISKLFTKRQGQ